MWRGFFVWLAVRATAFVALDLVCIHDAETSAAFFAVFTMIDLERTTERHEQRKRKGWT